MIASILWKEYREHRLVWSALALVGVLAIVVLPLVFPPEPSQEVFYRDALLCVALVLAWTYGVVCGSMLLAGEAENGTQTYLDLLPAPRGSMWRAKALAGVLLVAMQGIVIAGVVTAKGLIPPPYAPILLIGLLFVGGLGLGWGLCCSARARSVLSCIGWAFFTQFLLLPVVLLICVIPLVIITVVTGIHYHQGVTLLLGGVLGLALPWPVSALRYRAPDADRIPPPRRTDKPRRDLTASWRACFWLARRQIRGFAWAMVLFCLAAGFPVAALGLVFWPSFSLLVGVLCGVTVFFDEQTGPYRFLGDQRFPLTRLWLVKAGLRLIVAILSLAALLVPSVLALLIEIGQTPLRLDQGEAVLPRLFRTTLLGNTIPAGLFLFAPVMYGFSIGHIFGVVFRKALVSVMVSLGLTVLLMSLWAPSFLAGGLRAWQVLLVPAVLIVGARLLLRPWSTGQLVTRQGFARGGAVLAACLLLTTAGLWYRVMEIPDVPEPEGFQAFVDKIPKPEENEAGIAVRAGLTRLETLSKSWFPPGQDFRDSPAHLVFLVPQEGWPTDPKASAKLGAWLDGLFADDWWQRIGEARGKPVGVIDNPRLLTVATMDRGFPAAFHAGVLLPARGLQMQKKGDPSAFVDCLDIALTMARNLENCSPAIRFQHSRAVEDNQVRALHHWLAALPNDAVALRAAAGVLSRHRDRQAATPYDVALVEYLIARNSLDLPQGWLRQMLHGGPRGLPIDEAELLANAFQVPWEEVRQRKLVRALHWGRGLISEHSMRYLPFVTPVRFQGVHTVRHGRIQRRAALEAAVLSVALRRYQAEKGLIPKALTELVPEYLPAVPADPFDGQPFRYRLSAGERIVWVPESGPHEGELRDVPAGQGVLWCVGEDGRDDGGKQRAGGFQGEQGADVIFLVPLPAKP